VSKCHFLGLNELRHRLLHYPALTNVPVYSGTLCQYVYIPYFNVTSSGKGCSNGTPLIKKFQPLPFYQRRNNERRKKVLILNKYMAMGPSGARCQE
jgi:hypothetical protein